MESWLSSNVELLILGGIAGLGFAFWIWVRPREGKEVNFQDRFKSSLD